MIARDCDKNPRELSFVFRSPLSPSSDSEDATSTHFRNMLLQSAAAGALGEGCVARNFSYKLRWNWSRVINPSKACKYIVPPRSKRWVHLRIPCIGIIYLAVWLTPPNGLIIPSKLLITLKVWCWLINTVHTPVMARISK